MNIQKRFASPPFDPTFPERRDLYRLYGYLGAVALEGAEYLPLLTNALKRYL